MRLVPCAGAALLALAASAAQAENFNLTVPLVPNGGVAGSFAATYGVTHTSSGVFTDTFTFTGASTGQVTASLISIGLLPSSTLDISSVTLNGTPMPLLHPTGVPGLTLGSLPLMDFVAPLTLVVMGTAGPGLPSGTAIAASYAGTLNVSPVPEPQPALLLLTGLGLMGHLARRRLST